jgi:peptide deformylase
MILEIRKWPDPILRQKTVAVSVFDESLQELVKNMTETMRSESAIGIAANQVGDDRCVAVLEVPYTPGDAPNIYHGRSLVLVNPKIAESEGSVLSPEGCLSLTDTSDVVRRHASILVEYQDINGQPCSLRASGLIAFCIQHEIDHLEGKTLMEKASRIRKDMMLRRLKKTGNL